MAIVTLVCAGLFGWVDPDLPSADRATYQQMQATVGRTPDDQIRLALWCEAHGLTAERMRHLALAVLADPANTTARGLAGLVAREGRWQPPETIAATIRTDPAQTARLADYDQRRSVTPYSAEAQWALGVWADEQELKEQARAHFTAVIRLDPAHDRAWKRLGYKKFAGRWTTHDQIISAKTEADAQQHADKTWRPKLDHWKRMLTDPATAPKARIALLEVTDPRAVPEVEAVFGDGTAASEQVAVTVLGQIDGRDASLALASLAIQGQTPEVRRTALETLVPRDVRDVLSRLTRLVRTPWRYEIRAIPGPGNRGELFVEGERYNIRRVYTPPPLSEAILAVRTPGPASLPQANARQDDLARNPTSTPTRPEAFGSRPSGRSVVSSDQLSALVQRDLQAVAANVGLIRQDLTEDIGKIKTANAAIRANNDRILPILAKLTGQNLGEDHDAWERWQTDLAGYTYTSAATAKPTIAEMASLEYQSYSPILPPRGDCFARGTLVRTIDGNRPIEQIQRGDLVLVQNTVSGALSYTPVLTTFETPPATTFALTIRGETIVATGIHRFWQAGKGWTMARDLKVGDSLRVLAGVTALEAIRPEPSQPMFNLEVAEGRSFFVGQVGALVHDKSLIEPTPRPFDAPRSAQPVATKVLAPARR